MFGRKTVDGVMSALVRAVHQLRDVEDAQLDRGEELMTEALDLQSEATAALEEANRARAVRGNLEKLLGFTPEPQDDESL